MRLHTTHHLALITHLIYTYTTTTTPLTALLLPHSISKLQLLLLVLLPAVPPLPVVCHQNNPDDLSGMVYVESEEDYWIEPGVEPPPIPAGEVEGGDIDTKHTWIGWRTPGPSWQSGATLRGKQGRRPELGTAVMLKSIADMNNLPEYPLVDQWILLFKVAKGLALSISEAARGSQEYGESFVAACGDMAWLLNEYGRIGILEIGAMTKTYTDIVYNFLKDINADLPPPRGEDKPGTLPTNFRALPKDSPAETLSWPTGNIAETARRLSLHRRRCLYEMATEVGDLDVKCNERMTEVAEIGQGEIRDRGKTVLIRKSMHDVIETSIPATCREKVPSVLDLDEGGKCESMLAACRGVRIYQLIRKTKQSGGDIISSKYQ
eukprot:GHVQ01043505.1.p1 GENE.GHVQ01043505.1~~GHVQ01043505.1.p1  ORF type:complete len:378 (+),score=38.93 GHVQ01043505.1:200-1333(+)